MRRDTFEYMDFVRGAWDIRNVEDLFTRMSEEEIERIKNYTYQELLDDLFVTKNTRIYKDLSNKCGRKYHNIKEILPNIFKNTETHVKNPPWGWPKGKPNNNEKDNVCKEVLCAIRETVEETTIPESNFKIIDSSNIHYSELFNGSNGKTYYTKYFLCEMKEEIHPIRAQINSIRKTTVSDEVSEVRWEYFEEACKYLNPRRQGILKNVVDHISTQMGIYTVNKIVKLNIVSAVFIT